MYIINYTVLALYLKLKLGCASVPGKFNCKKVCSKLFLFVFILLECRINFLPHRNFI